MVFKKGQPKLFELLLILIQEILLKFCQQLSFPLPKVFNPNYASAYSNRWDKKYNLEDYSGAFKDARKAQ